MDKMEKAKAALWRIFDRCEEIECEENEGYKMLDDIRRVEHFIEKQAEPVKWELVYHDDNPSYYAKYVTARCSRCKTWYGPIDEGKGHKYGYRLASAFSASGYNDHIRSLMGWSLMGDAEKKVGELPNFCCHCGARMKGSKRNFDSYFHRRATA